MLIGVVGAPNKGKSTFFAAATMVDAQIANYPFTTITPNRGVTYVRAPCPHAQLGLAGCNPKNSKCVGGVRLVPVGMIDVPGLVPDAHAGKGLGNKFLDSIREADVLIQVVDATGKTDLQGNPCESASPAEEVAFLQEEIALWLSDIMSRGAKGKGAAGLAGSLTGLKIADGMLHKAALECGLDVAAGLPDDDGTRRLARKLVEMRMPIVVACNKMDVAGARAGFERVKHESGRPSMPCSAAVELALRKAEHAGVVEYRPGDADFTVKGTPNEKQLEALSAMKRVLAENGGSGVQQIIDYIVYQHLNCIIVYPVEDEHKYSNNKGDVLPDAYLVPKGTTALQLAAMVHTDLARKFIGAMDCRRHIRVGAEHALGNGDIIKIIAGR
ncbi:MAG: YchF-related putative GTPase [Candidatus Micrarchaeota archaeon]|nr:YchF-related putative GTPase [Candidatus Micrarchaeota archaeon]